MSRHKGYSIYQRKESSAWYVAWTDGAGQRQTMKAGNSRGVANEVGRTKAVEADRVRAGVLNPAEATAQQAGREPVTGHIDAWKKAIAAKGNTPKHVSHSKSRATALLKASGIDSLGGIRGELIQGGLKLIADKSSPQNARHYLTALKMFIRWCLRTDRLTTDPIRAVALPNVAGETFTRRPFTDAEFEQLIHATTTRATRCEVDGPDRAMFYRLMAFTGLRVSEARSLTPESFDLKSSPATVRVGAAYSKHRREDVLLLRSDFVGLITPWLARKKPGRLIFPFAEHVNLHRIFALDAKAAGIQAASDRERVGMHSFRRFFITRAIRSGGLAVAQDLARHSTPSLTKKYADLTVADHMAGLEALPKLDSASASASLPNITGNQRKSKKRKVG